MSAVRVAHETESDRLAELERLCEGRDAWSPALVAEGVAGLLPTTTWLVAPGDPAPGYAVVAIVDEVAELQRIGVDPVARRGGIARRLLAEVVDRSRRAGAVRLLLEVRETNAPALALYAAAGFVEIARRPRYYADSATALVMELTLTEDGADDD